MKGGVVGLAFLSLLMAAGVGFLASPGENRDPSKITIGAPDDSGGLVIHYILHRGGFGAAEIVSSFATYTMKDCCTSTSELALSTGELDMAVLCPDAAEKLVEKDPRFTIVGPVVLNSDIPVIRPGSHPRRIGVAQRRHFQERLVKERFSPECAAVPILPAGLPYALERGAVDGVVVDILKGLTLSGTRVFPEDSPDRATYVLVARKKLTSSLLYRQFMDSYKQAVEELSDPRNLARAVEGYKGIRWTNREIEEWKAFKVRFTFPPKAEA